MHSFSREREEWVSERTKKIVKKLSGERNQYLAAADMLARKGRTSM